MTIFVVESNGPKEWTANEGEAKDFAEGLNAHAVVRRVHFALTREGIISLLNGRGLWEIVAVYEPRGE